jgi:iron-sulfur cluster assembly protein
VSALLALTDNAVEAVKNIISSSDEPSEMSGLRMVAELAGTRANFNLSVVPLPAEDDQVIEEQGARVFLEPEAASLLDDKVLDASIEQDHVAFTIADQTEEKSPSSLTRRGCRQNRSTLSALLTSDPRAALATGHRDPHLGHWLGYAQFSATREGEVKDGLMRGHHPAVSRARRPQTGWVPATSSRRLAGRHSALRAITRSP